MIGFIKTLFSWPDGIVVGNLLASAIWGIPTFIRFDRLLKKHHKMHMEAINHKEGNNASNK